MRILDRSTEWIDDTSEEEMRVERKWLFNYGYNGRQ
jgi:hypothetical protein